MLGTAFLIGRFQPFHNGHSYLIRYGLQFAEHVVVLVGGSNVARSCKNPWSFVERKEMILKGIPEHLKQRVSVDPLPDVYTSDNTDNLWLANCYSIISKYVKKDEKFGIVGYKKDNSSYYLDMFPDAEQLILQEGFATLSATNIREAYFKDAPQFPNHLVPDGVLKYLIDFYPSDEFKYVLNEKKWFDDYNYSWAQSPFPPQFVTCDAVCIQMGHILLVTRGGHPGKGLLALPGGFVEQKKGDSFENVLHELWEETCIEDMHGRIPRGKLRGFYTGQEKRFDMPERSIRGYTLTTAFRFDFPLARKLFTVNGGDDAAAANWYKLSFVKDNPQMFFEDHYHIIMEMIT